MDCFENLIALLLRLEGWWTTTSYKVRLTKADKREIGTPSMPRWEIDVVAYKGATNEVLAIECKSFLDSKGVHFRDGRFGPEDRYKLFSLEATRRVVLGRLAAQLVESGACAPAPTVQLGLATGKIAGGSDRAALLAQFDQQGWRLLDDAWVRQKLAATSTQGYENEVAIVVAKLLSAERGK